MVAEFMKVMVNRSLQAAVIVCVVLLVRFLFSKLSISRKYIVLLWILPYLCLIMPWRPESDFSFWTVFSSIETKIMEYGWESEDNAWEKMSVTEQNVLPQVMLETEQAQETISGTVNRVGNEDTEPGKSDAEAAGQKISDGEDVRIVQYGMVALWLGGVLILSFYSIISYMKLHRKVLCSVCLKENIYSADDIPVPFVLGMIHPKIYLPSGMNEEDMQYVVAHEKTHILRFDPFKKTVAFAITGIYWLNPFMWLAFYFFGRDMEMACDEETIQRIGLEKKQDYANTLLQMASGRNRMYGMGVPLAFGEGETKGRIENLLSYKKTVGIVAVAAVVIVVGLCVVFLTEPGTGQEREDDVISLSDGKTHVGSAQGVDSAEGSDFVEESQINTNPIATEVLADAEMKEVIEVVVPVMNQEIISGVDGPILDYASEEMVVFHDYYGLFVYRINEGIIGAVDLETIGCQYTQGDNACQVVVEKDGSKVYLHAMNASDMYVYDVELGSLSKEENRIEEIDGFIQIKDINDCVDPDYTVLRSGQCVAISDFHYLESGSGLPIDLAWIVQDSNTKEQKQYLKLFENYGEKTVAASAESKEKETVILNTTV